jgi:F-type H+-transporting ATPase subunit delta
MKVSKVAAATARRLFGLCQTAGRLDETKLRTVVARLIESKPRDYRAVLIALQRLTISYTVNPELIGGLRIRVGNDVLDGSVQGRLTRLANAF